MEKTANRFSLRVVIILLKVVWSRTTLVNTHNALSLIFMRLTTTQIKHFRKKSSTLP